MEGSVCWVLEHPEQFGGSLPYLSNELRRLKMNTVGLSKMRNPGCGEISSGMYTFSCYSMNNHAHLRGISSHLHPFIVEVNLVDEHLMWVRLKHTGLHVSCGCILSYLDVWNWNEGRICCRTTKSLRYGTGIVGSCLLAKHPHCRSIRQREKGLGLCTGHTSGGIRMHFDSSCPEYNFTFILTVSHRGHAHSIQHNSIF